MTSNATEEMAGLRARIVSRQATVGVIGLGYVGLSVATALAQAGFRVVGVDIKAERVSRINAGECPIEGKEPHLPELLASVVRTSLVATTNYASLAEADVVLIDVDTPVAADHRPRFDALRTACRALGKVMKPGVLVIVESTVEPGTCDNVVAPLLEQASGRALNHGFYLGHCPERIMPGRLLENLRGMSRVCGGSTPSTREAMVALYETVVQAKLTPCDCVTAELVKTAENAYRDVNIAFANELGLICEAVGADFRRVRELVNEAPGRNVLFAGAGVGGHCIPKDPWLLVHGAFGFTPRLISSARAVNESMPEHMARLVEDALDEVGKPVAGSHVAILGYAYLENSDDTRNSPTASLVGQLESWGARVSIHDPWVPDYVAPVGDVVTGADAIVIMVAHDAYRALDLRTLRERMRSPVLVDGRYVIEGTHARDAGFVFRGLGRGRV